MILRDPIDLMIALTIGLVLGWLATGCPTPRACSPAETRCMSDAERVEVCDSSGQWTTALDCLAVEHVSGGQWRCQDTTTDEGEAIHACLPQEAP